jgi:SAM-dependent methyltransferase
MMSGFKRSAPSVQCSEQGETLAAIARRGVFTVEQIPIVQSTYFSDPGPIEGGPWDALRDAHLALPDWFVHGLDPYEPEYAQQQHRLWQLVAGVERGYDVEVDEKEADWGEVDAIRRPGYYVRRDPGAIAAASDHVIATGMLLKHCGLKAGDWAMEYGAGFAQTALALARMGVNVDTVDVSERFCGWVRDQAEFFGVPLSAFKGRFGDAPRAERRYDLIWFYESFHHCLDFVRVVRGFRSLLAPGGRIILSGEPVVERENQAVPYPWGLRLHSEVVAVVRRQRWFELGFSEDFLSALFVNAGFTIRRIDCEPSMFGRLYVCEHQPAEMLLDEQWFSPGVAAGWGAAVPGDGRWMHGESCLPVRTEEADRMIGLEFANPDRRTRSVEVHAAGTVAAFELDAFDRRSVDVVVPARTRELKLISRRGSRQRLSIGRRFDGPPEGVRVVRVRDPR